MMTKDDLNRIGFKAIPTYTVTDASVYKLGRHRLLSIGCVGTPNEMLWICEMDDQDDKNVTDSICLHNYDYDGYLTEEKLTTLINTIVFNKNNQ